ncbi:MAG TPA: OsmC family protein [Ferruginibacter sp.]|mgnify:FL=1|nr:OsmC family protein [Ferruginibacter sp.]
MNHFMNAKHKENMQFSALIDGHELSMDTSTADGGNNSAASPKKLMLAALTGCTGVDIVSILNKMKVPFSDLSIEADAELTGEYTKVYSKVTVIYNIKISPENRPKMQKAVNLSAEKYCGVMDMFRSFAQIKTVINYR